MEEVHSFLEECEKRGYKWANDRIAATKKDYGYQNTGYCPDPASKELTYTSISDAEDSHLKVISYSCPCKPDSPRICFALGGEKGPLEIGEHFRVQGYVPEFWINKDASLEFDGNNFTSFAFSALVEAINDPAKVIRRPQFSDDEKALMRLLVKNGLPYVARDEDTNLLFAYANKPMDSGDGCFEDGANENICPAIPDCLFPQITYKNSPFDAAAYLESEAQG